MYLQQAVKEGSDMRSVDLQKSSSWRKSSYSAANGDCVEVGRLADSRIGVRDSKDASAAALSPTLAGWRAFIGEVKRGRLDLA
jgi:Domain of unknown function (DUF397)